MTAKDLKNAKAWVQAWKRASKKLANLRDLEIRQSDTEEAIRALASNFRWALRQHPPSPTSGLVEQQRLFSKLHPR